MFKKIVKKGTSVLIASAMLITAFSHQATVTSTIAAAEDPYMQRFLELREELHDSSNGYFSADGIPYHSIETLMVEAPDYGHVTTSEAMSYYMWLEAMYGKFTGDFSAFETAWQTAETYMIPNSLDQLNSSMANYNASKPATYAPEWETPSLYPAQLNFSAAVGVDPINSQLVSAYGTNMIYGMHWLLDVDNWYGYGRRGDKISKPSYINTFQRGAEESTWETIPQPCYDTLSMGGKNGYLDLFTGDSNYAAQFKYTNAPDADARAVQATYWANEWAKEQGQSVSSTVSKASKMGDYLRYAMFDKYFRKIGASQTAGTGYDSAHYLMSWYYAWGGGINASWAWKIGSSHNHAGYQNPMTAWILSSNAEFKPKSSNGASDWATSLTRQLEFYQWLQSAEGAIAGGATNSVNGRYEAVPSGTSTFYGMAYEENPVYHDPGSNTWFGFQAWSMQRVAEYYYKTGDTTAKSILDKWVAWIKTVVRLKSDGTFEIPNKLDWSGQPNTWTGKAQTNSNLSVTVVNYGTDLGVAGSLANALSYYAKAANDDDARLLAKEILDRIWTNYRDDKGVSSLEAREDYSRFFEQEVYVPEGWKGTMPNGDVIEPGVTFLDIRSKYLQDPDYQDLLDAYNAGVDPEFRYHRFWAQCDVAIANGVYSILFGGNEVEEDATISPVTATFNKANQSNIAVTMTLNGNSLNGIALNGTSLVAGTDYTVSGNSVTIYSSYLASLSLGSKQLTFDFSPGVDRTLTVTVVNDVSVKDSIITPTTATFDKKTENQNAISVTMTLNGNTLSAIKNGSTALTGSQYTVAGNTVTISKSYLAGLPLGTTTLTFDFSAGVDRTLTITVIDTTEVVSGNIKVQMFVANTNSSTNGIMPRFRLFNTGTTNINLSDVKIRYYYTIDGEKSQNFWCDWSHVGSNNITGTFVKMSSAASGADYYLEVGFTSGAGTLKAGESIEVQARFSKNDWSNYTQTGDYSFNSTSNNYTDWNKATGYIAGKLQWGIEP